MPKIVKNKAFQAVSVFSVMTLIIYLTVLGVFFRPSSVWGQQDNENINGRQVYLYCEVEGYDEMIPCAIVSGYKFEDLNQNGEWDAGEPALNDWEICQEKLLLDGPITNVSGPTTSIQIIEDELRMPETPDCVLTGDGDWEDGYYEFTYYSGGVVTLTETMQDGWTASNPESGSQEVNEGISISPAEYPDYNFGNYLLPYCGDGEVNGEDACDNGEENGLACTPEYGDSCTYCSDTCEEVTLEGAFCGDGVVNGEEECDAAEENGNRCVAETDKTCTYCSKACAHVTVVGPKSPAVVEVETAPVLEVRKTVESGTYYPGDSINYIVTIKNVGDETAKNIRIADTMPAGFTYEDGSGGTWFFGDLKIDKEMNHIYTVTVGTDVAPDKYINTVQVSADNHDAVKAKASVEILEKRGVVLGAATSAPEELPEELPAAGLPIGLLAAITVVATAGASVYRLRK